MSWRLKSRANVETKSPDLRSHADIRLRDHEMHVTWIGNRQIPSRSLSKIITLEVESSDTLIIDGEDSRQNGHPSQT